MLQRTNRHDSEHLNYGCQSRVSLYLLGATAISVARSHSRLSLSESLSESLSLSLYLYHTRTQCLSLSSLPFLSRPPCSCRRWLHLGSNYFTGTIPQGFSLLTNLQWVSLGPNSLTGTVPTELSALSSLGTLNTDLPQWLHEAAVPGARLQLLHRLASVVTECVDGADVCIRSSAGIACKATCSFFCSFKAHVSFAMCVCGRYLDVSSNQLNGSSLAFLRTFAQLQYVGISLVECVVASAMIRDRGF